MGDDPPKYPSTFFEDIDPPKARRFGVWLTESTTYYCVAAAGSEAEAIEIAREQYYSGMDVAHNKSVVVAKELPNK